MSDILCGALALSGDGLGAAEAPLASSMAKAATPSPN
jgi:hypothetical protein